LFLFWGTPGRVTLLEHVYGVLFFLSW